MIPKPEQERDKLSAVRILILESEGKKVSVKIKTEAREEQTKGRQILEREKTLGTSRQAKGILLRGSHSVPLGHQMNTVVELGLAPSNTLEMGLVHRLTKFLCYWTRNLVA